MIAAGLSNVVASAAPNTTGHGRGPVQKDQVLSRDHEKAEGGYVPPREVAAQLKGPR